MKAIVVGVGSIGSRHLRNLVEMGHSVYAVDLNINNLEKVSALATKTYSNLQIALHEVQPDAAFICTYSNDHILPALHCAKAGCHLFIEKPLSLSLDGIEDLIRVADEKGLTTMVACNMRFHPALRHIHETITNNPAFRQRYWADVEFGYYLPFAKKDYQTCYMANRSMGGNLIFDSIHELDYAVWFFGEPIDVVSVKSILSDLQMDTEDSVDMIIRFRSGTRCSVHLDYLQHGYSRRCKIVGNSGTLVWDFAFGRIGITTGNENWSWTDMKFEIYYNQMYVDEMKYFVERVIAKEQTFNTIKDALPVIKLALASNRSCESRVWERV